MPSDQTRVTDGEILQLLPSDKGTTPNNDKVKFLLEPEISHADNIETTLISEGAWGL